MKDVGILDSTLLCLLTTIIKITQLLYILLPNAVDDSSTMTQNNDGDEAALYGNGA